MTCSKATEENSIIAGVKYREPFQSVHFLKQEVNGVNLKDLFKEHNLCPVTRDIFIRIHIK
jgi:hypothetical protein